MTLTAAQRRGFMLWIYTVGVGDNELSCRSAVASFANFSTGGFFSLNPEVDQSLKESRRRPQNVTEMVGGPSKG